MRRAMNAERTVLAVAAAVLVAVFLWWQATDHQVAAPSAPAPTPDTATAAQAAVPVESRRGPVRLVSAEAEVDPTSSHGTLAGRVLDWATGAGVAGAELTFLHDGSHTVISGADGAFRLEASEPGQYDLALVAASGYLPFAPEWGQSPISYAAAPGARISGVVIYLTPAVVYDGRVLGPDGEPVAGALVRVSSDQVPELMVVDASQEVRSDARGEFQISAPDGALVEATHPDFGPGRARVDFSAQVSHRLTIRLTDARDRAALTIAGQVLGPDGAPAERAQVEADPQPEIRGRPGGELVPSRRVLTGDDGRFELADLEPGPYRLVASLAPHAPAVRAAVEAGSKEVELRLREGNGIRGKVVDAKTGDPVAAFTVLVRAAGYARDAPPPRNTSIFDAGGQYELTGLVPGRTLVQVVALGYAPAGEVSVDVPTPPAPPATADFELSRGSRIFGTVLDEPSRAPLQGARVTVEGRTRTGDTTVPIAGSTLTDASGAFELGGIAVQTHSILAAAAGHHGRIVSGLSVEEEQDVGPIEILLSPVVEGEKPALDLTGIGAVLSAEQGALVIGQVAANGGAFEVGLAPGDKIFAIDGKPWSELDFNDAINAIRGPAGTTVTLTVQKAESDETTDIEVPRRKFRYTASEEE
jgi:hypothetical protein